MGTAPERVRMFVLCAWHSNALLKCLAVLLCLTITCTFQNLIKICVFRCMSRGSGHTLHPQTPGRERVGWALPQVPSPSRPTPLSRAALARSPTPPSCPQCQRKGRSCIGGEERCQFSDPSSSSIVRPAGRANRQIQASTTGS